MPNKKSASRTRFAFEVKSGAVRSSLHSAKTRVDTRDWTAALFSFLSHLSTDAIEGGFDACFFVGDKFKSALQRNVWGIHLKN